MKSLLSIALLLASPLMASAQVIDTYTIAQQYELHSEILNEDRSYWISLPESYEQNPFYHQKRYPILVLLDGQRLLHITSGIVRQMSHGSVEEIPEMIIVAVENTNRDRDLRPDYRNSENDGAERFMEFIQQELLTVIDAQYRTIPCRVLVGHSFAGLFVADAFIHQEGFAGYLAIDPSLWWQGEGLRDTAAEILKQEEPLKGELYVSQANNPFNPGLTASRLGQAVQSFKALLEADSIADLHYQFDFFPKEDHFSIPTLSLYAGLRFVFRHYRYDLASLPSVTDADLEHYAADLERLYGPGLSPPGRVYDQIGNFLYTQPENTTAALAILAFNRDAFPNTIATRTRLAAALALDGQTAAAITELEAALLLEPENEGIRQQLAELRSEDR